MQKPLFVFSFFFAALHLWSQSGDVFNYPLSAKNLQSYNAICGQLATRPYTKGAFEQTRTIQRLNRSLVSKGDFIIASEAGLAWITKSPFPSVTVLGKDYVIQSAQGGTESRISAQGNQTFIIMAETLSSLFTGNAHMLQARFDNYFTETQGQGGKSWTVGLIPKEQGIRSYARQFILEGTEGTGGALIRSLVIHEQTGDSVAYVFSQHSFPAELEAHEKAYFSAR
jgi:hypothetical protein